MNIKPTSEQCQVWSSQAESFAINISSQGRHGGKGFAELFNTKFAELAAQWGAQQAQSSAPVFEEVHTALKHLDDIESVAGKSGPSIQLREAMLRMNEKFNAIQAACFTAQSSAQQAEPPGCGWAGCGKTDASGTVHDCAYPDCVTSSQPSASEPELPEPVAYTYQNRYTDQHYLTWRKSDGGKNWNPLFGAAQMQAHYAAGVRAGMAQQTTEPLGFQIRRAIAAEDELRATKQTLEHAYAALQKVADAQAAIEEPELPDTGEFYTAAQMHDHFQAGVRAGMGQSQWQTIDSAPKD